MGGTLGGGLLNVTVLRSSLPVESRWVSAIRGSRIVIATKAGRKGLNGEGNQPWVEEHPPHGRWRARGESKRKNEF
jgi:hypothetical protein